MANANKAKGTAFETAVVRASRDALSSSTPVHKPRQEGPADVGDVHVGEDIILQCKDHGSWSKQSLYDWIDAAASQAIAAKRPWSAVVIKRRRGTRSTGKIGDAVVSMSLDTFNEIIYDLEEGRAAIADLEELVAERD